MYYPPCGIFNETYRKDIAIFRTTTQKCLIIGVLLLLFFVIPFLFGDYILSFILTIAIFIIAVLGLYLQIGLCGQINIGQAAFMAVGAYACAILMNKLGFSFWTATFCAGICAGIAGGIFGIPAVRLKGFYLLIATLAAHFLIIWALTNLPSLTGGIHGMTVPAPKIGSLVFDSVQTLYFPFMAITVLMVFFAKNIGRSRIGRAFVAIRDSDLAANVMGINVAYYKFLAFAVSSFFAGVAGSLYGAFMTGVNVEFFTLNMSIWFIAMLIIGGMDSVVGAILGTIFIQILNEITSEAVVPAIIDLIPSIGNTFQAGLPLIVFALVLIIFLIFEPRGINHRWETFKNYYRLYPFPY